jgi:cation transport regulator
MFPCGEKLISAHIKIPFGDMMPYDNIEELPSNVRNPLPKEAQKIFKEAFNNAWERYKDMEDRRDDTTREEAAMKVAWSAVKRSYHKNDQGKWVRKDFTSRRSG